MSSAWLSMTVYSVMGIHITRFLIVFKNLLQSYLWNRWNYAFQI